MQGSRHGNAPDFAAAMARARRLLPDDPVQAAADARIALKAAPDNAEASLILGAALRRAGDFDGARDVLVALTRTHPQAWGAWFEAGIAWVALGETRSAIDALGQAAALNPRSFLAWHALGDQLAIAGDEAGADRAHARPLAGSLADPALMEAARTLFDGRRSDAAIVLRDRFNLHLGDIAAVRLLADAGLRLGRAEAVEAFVAPYLDRAPRFAPLRLSYALALYRGHRPAEALAQVALARRAHPDAGLFRALEAAIRVDIGDYDAALTAYRDLVEARPDQPRLWLSYGHVLKTVGRQAEAIAAYRRSLALQPSFGEAYWSLANLKVARFQADDRAAMRGLMDRQDLGPDDRTHLHFALGKALEDEGRFEDSFAHYRDGNASRRALAPHDADAHHAHTRRLIEAFTPDRLAARAGVGCTAADPIFVVGLPRSGSTLIEQILASHSAIEGTAELPHVTAIARRLAQGDAPLASEADALAALGQDYLARSRPHRTLGRPFFVDKLPGNFLHAGLIHLILPNAKIIDARRGAMACCWSAFKQCFAQGQGYSYDLTDLGRYYADYAALMAHFDRVLPGRIHRVRYEDMVRDSEAEVRRLLDYCGLPFEDSCLRFHETSRPVRTASSEQVRRPIFTESLDQWRHFEPWLGPLRLALGPSLADS